MRIVVLPPRGVVFTQDSPWQILLDGLRACGHEVEGYGKPVFKPEALIALNDQPSARVLQRRFSIPTRRSVLVVLEPRVTAPRMYTKSILGRYGHRFAASPLWAARIHARPFLWPQTIASFPIRVPRFEFEATMVNANKRSAVGESLYGLRRAVIEEADARGVSLAVFGPGWESAVPVRIRQGFKETVKAAVAGLRPQIGEAFSDLAIRPQRWKGHIQDKVAAFSTAPLSVIIENSADYVSEKLVDAISTGVVPIYVGPKLNLFNLPTDLAISSPPDSRAVVSTISRRNTTQLSEVTAAGQEWLHSKAAMRHDARIVLYSLGTDIGEILDHA